MVNEAIKTAKNPTTYFLNDGCQIRRPAAICITPRIFQTIGEMLDSNEHGGSRNERNLSAPTIKKRRLQIAVTIFRMFI